LKDTFLSGVAMTRFGKLDESLMDMAEAAARGAIADAGLLPEQIDSLYFGNFLGRGIERQGVMASLLAERLAWRTCQPPTSRALADRPALHYATAP
jgi:acetyl-CoA C-acetyltransferase/acetyl-CoA acyltransferase